MERSCAVARGIDINSRMGGRIYIMSVPLFRVRPPGYFTHISITTPIVSALKNYYRWGFLEVPTDILNNFWIQVAVSEVKRPLHGRFGSETDKNLTAIYLTDIPQRTQVSVRVQRSCNGCGRWSKPTALFWCQNLYRELSQFPLRQLSATRGRK